jgi:hypothetical protein
MTILLSQLFSPATLVGGRLLAPDRGISRDIVIARPARSGTARDRLLNAVLWLRPAPEERPYAL